MSHQRHTSTTDGPLVVGQHVTGTSRGPSYETPFAGTYDGLRPSEWDGTPHHFFVDGRIGVTPQSIFSIPADQLAA